MVEIYLTVIRWKHSHYNHVTLACHPRKEKIGIISQQATSEPSRSEVFSNHNQEAPADALL